MESKRIAAIIPALNESVAIRMAINELQPFVSVVIVVDDGSCDNTSALAEAGGAVVLKHVKTRGYGAALKSGLAEAFEIGMDLAVFADGDGAHDAAAIPALVKTHTECDAELTLGSRLINGGKSIFPSPKESVNRMAAAVFRRIANINVTDVACGMRLLSRKTMKMPVATDNFGYAFDMLVEAVQHGLRIAEVGVPVRYDASEPLVSRICEILAFLTAMRRLPEANKYENALKSMSEAIGAYNKVTVSVEGTLYYFHPAREYKAYLVQEQHSAFRSRRTVVGTMVAF